MIIYKFKNLVTKSQKSLREIAKATEISHVTLSRLARARNSEEYNVCADVLNKLCEYFKVSKIAELMEYKKG